MQEIKEVLEGLTTRFNITLQSLSEKDFYLNLYYYFDFIHKTPELLSVFNKSYEDYMTKYGETWKEKLKTDEEINEKGAQMMKFEKFNLYAVGASIYMKIYLPIQEYKNTNEPDDEQDPVAIILIKGLEYAISLNKWNKKSLESYNRWFEGRRNRYTSQLQRFHIMFLNELMETKEKTNDKLIINFNRESGILLINNIEIHIQQKSDKPNACYVLEYIFDNKEGLKEKSYYSEILDKKFTNSYRNWRTIHRACLNINDKVDKQGKIKDFLIIKTGETGYTHINPKYL